jgi:hypothetical protein
MQVATTSNIQRPTSYKTRYSNQTPSVSEMTILKRQPALVRHVYDHSHENLEPLRR